MVKILKDTDLQSLEANINGIIREKYEMIVQDVKIDLHHFKDYYDDGRICNQWTSYVAVIIFKNK
jgi:hypothetical protein